VQERQRNRRHGHDRRQRPRVAPHLRQQAVLRRQATRLLVVAGRPAATLFEDFTEGGRGLVRTDRLREFVTRADLGRGGPRSPPGAATAVSTRADTPASSATTCADRLSVIVDDGCGRVHFNRVSRSVSFPHLAVVRTV
jgi:hypothetical protein